MSSVVKPAPETAESFSRELVFDLLKRISRGLAETMGPDCEVIVHDLVKTAKSIVHIENGHVTGRQVGDGIRDLASILRSDRFHDDALANYVTETPSGKTIKSMTVLLRDQQQVVQGALCVNIDLSSLLLAKGVLERSVAGVPLHGDSDQSDQLAEAPQDVLAILDHIIERTIAEYSVPVSRLTRLDKLQIVSFLNEREAFRIRGAVDRVAASLDVSRYTIYNYLEEVRSQKDRQG